ncbi:MAG: hypothetical protein LBU66_02035 [Treponema sp.]|nr:hypothetical protein [Treponema sp.]
MEKHEIKLIEPMELYYKKMVFAGQIFQDRIIRMTFIFFVFALLFASLYSHPENINFADADYCINWMDEENKFDTRLVFVKKNDDSKIQPDTLYSMECIGRYSMSIYYNFYFIDESGQKLFSFGSLLPALYGAAAWEFRSRSSRYFIKEMNDRLLSPVIQVDFPNTTGYLETAPSTFKKEDLLQFEGKIVDAHIDYSIKCPPDLDATHRINFRVKITGLCEPDFLNNSGLEDR